MWLYWLYSVKLILTSSKCLASFVPLMLEDQANGQNNKQIKKGDINGDNFREYVMSFYYFNRH